MEMLAAPGSTAWPWAVLQRCLFEDEDSARAAPLGDCGPGSAEPSLSPVWEPLPPTEPLLSAPLLRGCTSVLGICQQLPLPLKEGAAAFHLPLFRVGGGGGFPFGLHGRGQLWAGKARGPLEAEMKGEATGGAHGTCLLDPMPLTPAALYCGLAARASIVLGSGEKAMLGCVRMAKHVWDEAGC